MNQSKDNENMEIENNEEEIDFKKPIHGKNFIEDDKTIQQLQASIQSISKKIEEGKISLRILQERYIKKQSEYNQLAGKPIIKSKEQKLDEIKEKMHKLKNHQIFDPNYGKKNPILQPG